MAKKIFGTCCICGRETKLTFEHIPPRAAFNQFNLKVYDFWGYIMHENTRYKQFQNGAGKYTLCQSCNNLTGEWYGSAYADFANQGMRYFRGDAKGLISVPYTIYPLRVFKQIVSCFASVNGSLWCQNNRLIRDFLLNPYARKFPDDIDIRMYMQMENRVKIGNGISGLMNAFTGERLLGSEWGYPPFSYICICDKNYANFRALNELCPIKSFLQYGYDERVTIYLNIPRKPCNPTMLDFRDGVPDIGKHIQLKRSKKRKRK